VPAYGFNAADARRIAEVVRASEHKRIGGIGLGADENGGSKPGVRLLIGKHEGVSWPTGSTAVVTIYSGDAGSVASVATMVAYNQYISFSEDSSCTARWVALGHNGFAWHPVDSQSDCGSCLKELGGVDFRVLTGYQSTAEQILGHDSGGCVRWYDVFTCATAAT